MKSYTQMGPCALEGSFVQSFWQLNKRGTSACLENPFGVSVHVNKWNNPDKNKGKWRVLIGEEEFFYDKKLTIEEALGKAWHQTQQALLNWMQANTRPLPMKKPEPKKHTVYEFEDYEHHGCTGWGPQRRTTARPQVAYTNNGIFWNSQSNSYVLVKPPEDINDTQKEFLLWPNGLALCAINGAGEIRWDVEPKKKREFYQPGDLEAVIYFGLIPNEDNNEQDSEDD